MFSDAVQKMLGKDLHCPKCHAENLPNASPTIRLDTTASRAECSQCSYEAVIEKFHQKGS